MERRHVFVLLLVCVAFIVLSNAQGASIPRCCLKLSKGITPRLLRSVASYYVQKKNGRCEIDALILYVKRKKICGHPKLLPKLKKRKIPEQKLE